MRARRLTAALLLALAFSWAQATTAGAGSAHVETFSHKYGSRVWVRYHAAPGERNRLHVRRLDATSLLLRDAVGIAATPGCGRLDARTVRCATSDNHPLDGPEVFLGDRNDTFRNEGGGAVFDGGRGDDVAHGSEWADIFLSEPGRDTLYGGLGPDRFDQGRRPDGADTFHGGPNNGPDLEGPDVVNYEVRRRHVRATIGRRRDDGARRERDFIGADVESVRGGRGSDLLRGDADDNQMFSGRGSDVVLGGAGADEIFLGGDPYTAPPRGARRPRADGGPGDDGIYGSMGPDLLIGGPGGDQIFARGGNDRIDVRDTSSDVVSCGDGSDTVLADALDSFFDDAGENHGRCERIAGL